MSAAVLTHPRFDRPPVANPHKRRRKGTIDLGKERRRRAMLTNAFGTLNPTDDARPLQWKDQRNGLISVMIDGNIGTLRLIRALQSEGLMLRGDGIVEWPIDPEDLSITTMLHKIINELSPSELIEALEAIKAIKARRGRAT